MNAPDAPALEVRALSGTGADGESVHGLSASFAAGRFHVLRGAAGSGREVLLRLLGLLQAPSEGEVLVHGTPTRQLSAEARAELRTQRFGFVFAAPFLLTSFNVIENVAMPLFKVSQVTPEEARRRTETVLSFVGLAAAAEAAIEELPLCAQYQVALARGLINEPSFLLVEKVDGVLVGDDLQAYLELLQHAGERFRTTIIATAAPTLPLLGSHRVLDLADGIIIADAELLPEAES